MWGKHTTNVRNVKAPFGKDRYHAKAVDTDEHLARCLTYIDMNMVRAGVVNHPRDWPASGFHEIQTPFQRCRIVDHQALLYLLEISSLSELQQRHLLWIDDAIQRDDAQYNAMWSNSIAVGNEAFVKAVKSQPTLKAKYRDIDTKEDAFLQRETDVTYTAHFVGETDVLSTK